MAYCNKCGNEIQEGTKFCLHCGAPIENGSGIMSGNEDKLSGFDKYGKYLGIVLIVFAIINISVETPIFRILLSVLIIAGGIFCLGRKYKLKFLTVVAVILACICFIGGVTDVKDKGLFGRPKEDKYLAEISKDDETEESDEGLSEESGSIEENAELSEEASDEEDTEVASESESTENVSETDSSETEETIETSDIEEKSADGVDPDLKAFLDSYEEFIDEYVDFMKKYNNDSSNSLSMIGEYSDIMKKYADFADKIDKYDSDNMSTADYKYYMEVTTRCSQKMLSAY